MNTIHLGALDAPLLGLVACVLLLVLALTGTWKRLHHESRTRQHLERRIAGLEASHRKSEEVLEVLTNEARRLERHILQVDPEMARRRDQNLVALLRSLLDYSQSIRRDENDATPTRVEEVS